VYILGNTPLPLPGGEACISVSVILGRGVFEKEEEEKEENVEATGG
jgi:hypothetical protein